MKIKVNDAAAKRLAELLKEEGGDAVVRIREVQSGTPCKRKTELRLSIDEREDSDVDGQASALPFVINEDLADQYGKSFVVEMDAEGTPVVKVG